MVYISEPLKPSSHCHHIKSLTIPVPSLLSSLLFAACDKNSLKSIIKPIYASASSKALLKTSTRLSLNSHASSTTSFPFFPPPFLKPPRPSCRTSAACPSWSKAMVRVVGNNGVSNDVGSGRRCVLFFCDIIY